MGKLGIVAICALYLVSCYPQEWKPRFQIGHRSKDVLTVSKDDFTARVYCDTYWSSANDYLLQLTTELEQKSDAQVEFEIESTQVLFEGHTMAIVEQDTWVRELDLGYRTLYSCRIDPTQVVLNRSVGEELEAIRLRVYFGNAITIDDEPLFDDTVSILDGKLSDTFYQTRVSVLRQ